MAEPNKNYGGYKSLKSYQMTRLVYDLTVEFCRLFIDTSHEPDKSYRWNRQADQMIQAARSRRQNIAEGSVAARTSRKNELKLVNVARASLSELLEDYQDFLRQQSLKQWYKDSPEALAVRNLYRTHQADKTDQADKSDRTYKSYMTNPEQAANMLICLINQANYLLDKQIETLEKDLMEKGEVSLKAMSYKETLLAKIKTDDQWVAELNKTYKTDKT